MQLAGFLFPQYFDNNGNPLSGGKIYAYAADTVTPQDTYSNAAGTALNTNPITLSSSGRTKIFLQNLPYDFVIKNSVGVTIDTISGVGSSGQGGLSSVASIGALRALAAGAFDYVEVGGYSDIGDGGGGLFYWSASSTATQDYGVVITPLSSPITGRWIRMYSGPVNVKWFGAKGDGSTNDLSSINTANAYVQGISQGGTLFFPESSAGYLHSTALVFGTKVAVLMDEKGAFFTSAGQTITFNGKFVCGRTRAFADATGTVTFGEGSTAYIYPQWRGAIGDGATDDEPALNWAFGFGVSQYTGVGVDLGSYKYFYTKRLVIKKQVTGQGARLIPGGTGAQFKIVNNPSPTSNAGVDCTICIMDGGALNGVTIYVDNSILPAFDIPGNAGIWLVNAQENYGKSPITNCRMNGAAAGRNLNGLTSRFNTTCLISNVGGSYFANGFRAYNNNICSFDGLFFEHVANVGGNKPFEFVSVGQCRISSLWTEYGGDAITGFTFDSCGYCQVSNLQTGDPTIGVSWLGAVRVISCSDMDFKAFIYSTNTWVKTKTWVIGSSSRCLFDDSYEATGNTYGLYGTKGYTNLIKGIVPFPSGMDLGDTTIKFLIGLIPYGGTLSITLTSKSGAITTPAVDIYKLVGGTYTNRGTLTFASFASAGDRKTLTLNLDASSTYYISPSAGSGYVDVEWEYNNVNGNAFVT